MKNKKGFTLIELLAVIVILAIIALIAVPVILNMINSARKSAARSAALGYIDAIEYNNGFASLGSDAEVSGYTKITSGNVSEITSTLGRHLKGKAPTSGSVAIDSNGKVESATDLCFNGYKVQYDGKDAKVEGKCSGESSELTSTFGGTIDKSKQYTSSNVEQKGLIGVAYLDPSDLSATCNKELSDANVDSTTSLPTGIKTGCMKFYIYDDSGDTYKMILDHNTTAKVAWVTKTDYNNDTEWDANTSRNSKGPITANAQLATDTTGWVGSPRLIIANEIATITNTTTFDGSSSKWFYFNGTGDNKQTKASSSQGDNEYAWLFDYTNGCTSYGCNTDDSSTYGYWTSSPVSFTSNNALDVCGGGSLLNGDVGDDNFFGVRPVITISKSKLQ